MRKLSAILLTTLISIFFINNVSFAQSQPMATFTGENADDYFGKSVASAGDVNGDNIDDIIVGAHGNDAGGQSAGRTYIFYGGSLSNNINAAQADVIITGENPGDYFGRVVSGAGDVNGDGSDDIIVGVEGNDAGGQSAGRTYIFYGGSLSGNINATQADVIITGEYSRDYFGHSVASAGDVNGDGMDDIIVGTYSYSVGGYDAGRAYVFYGGSLSGNYDASQADVIITGENADDYFGKSVASAGDVNGDNIDDIIVGAHGNDAGGQSAGRTYIFYGGSLSSNINAAQADVIITGENGGDYFGWSVASAGDVNEYNVEDIIVGTFNGRAYVFYDGSLSGSINAAQADVIITGENPGDFFGRAVSGAGDVNGDGSDDIVVGAYGNDGGGSNAGRAYIFYGGSLSGNYDASQADVIMTGENPGDSFGHSVSSAGDVDGDNIEDVAVGAYGAAAGKAYLYAGTPIIILSPKGGEYLSGYQNFLIKWRKVQNFNTDHYTLSYSIDSGNNYPNLITDNISSTDSTYNWLVPSINSSTVRVKIIAKNVIGDTLAEASSNSDFTIDSTPPGTFELLSPPNNAWTNSTPNFTWGYSSGTDYYQLWIDGNLHLNNLTTFPRSVTLPDSLALSASWHTWYMTAVDNAGNSTQSNQTRAIRVDTATPSSFNILNPVNNQWVNTPHPQFTWQASSDPGGSGLDKYVLKIDSTVFEDNISLDSTSVTPGNEIEQGDHLWQIEAVDNVGNVQPSNQEWLVKIDSWGPGRDYSQGVNGDYYTIIEAGINTQFNNYITSQLDPNINFDTNIRPPGVPSSCAVRWTGYIKSALTGTYNLRIYHNDGVKLWINNTLVFDYWGPWAYANHYSTFYFEADKWYSFKLEFYNGPYGSGHGLVTLYWTPPGGNEEIVPTTSFLTNTVDFDLVSPINYQWVGTSSPSFTWKSTEDLGIGWEKYQLYVDGNLNTDNIYDTTYTITNTLNYGSHTWYVISLDSLNNTSQSNQTWTVRIDDVAPNTFNTIAPSQDSIVLTPVPDFTWQSTSDQGSGMDHFELVIDDVVDRDNISYYTTTVQPSSPLNEGWHTWAVLAVDNVGNITSTDTIGFWVEYSNPPTAFTLISPINNDTVYTDLPTFWWNSSSDIGSGIQKYEVYVGNTKIGETQDTTFTAVSSLTNGPYSWHVIAYDGINLSTSSNVENFYVNVDNLGPITEISDPIQSQILTTSSYTIQGNVDDNVGGSGVDSVFISTDGGSTWGPAQMTKMKNEKYVDKSDIRSNNKVSLLNIIKSNKTFTNSNLKIPEPWTYFWNGYSDRSHLILARAVDLSGNYGNTDSVSVLVDTQPPAVDTCIINPPFVSTDSIYLTVNFIEEVSGLDVNYPPTVEFTPVGGTPISVTQTSYNATTKTWTGQAQITSSMNDGIAAVEIRDANDLAGNTMSVNTNYSFLIDQIPPTNFELVAPDSGIWLNQRSPLFVWHPSNDFLSGLSHYDFIINSAVNVGQISPGDTSTYPSSPLSDAAYSWQVDVFDAANNTTSSPTWIVKIDSTSPIVDITYPHNGDTLQFGQVTVTGAAHDGLGIYAGIGVDSVFLSLDGGSSWSPVNSDSANFSLWSFPWTINNKGHYTLKAKGRDLLGTSSLPGSGILVILPNTPPHIVNPIPDVMIPEDADTTLIVQNLNDVFGDTDGDVLSYVISNPDTNLNIWTTGDTSLWLKSALNYFGQTELVVFADDGDGGVTSDSVTITVLSVNDPPQIVNLPDSLSFPSDSSITLDMQLFAYDVDTPDSLLSWQFQVSNDSLIYSFNDTTKLLALTVDPNFVGDVQLYCTITDDSGAFAIDSIAVTVNIVDAIDELADLGIPKTYELWQNYPNPFNPQTTIVYGLPRNGKVTISIYDILGRKIETFVNEAQKAGYHKVTWNASGYSSGIYFYVMETKGLRQSKKLVLIR